MENHYVVLTAYIKETAILDGGYRRIHSYTTESNHATQEQAQKRADLLNSSLSRESAFGKMPSFVAEYGTERHWNALNVRRFF